jgi:NADPH:quinone reductase-like Zn-dependent oxidoreductase
VIKLCVKGFGFIMKAIIQKVYGDESTLQMVDVAAPKIKKSNQILVKVNYANVSAGDKNINTLNLSQPIKTIMRLVFGFNGPRAKIRGISGSGVIKAVGLKVKDYKVGDNVNFINSIKAGVMAEYLLLNSNSKVCKVDKETSLEAAAPIAFGALTDNHFINEKTIKKGDKVLVYGASGSVGSYAIQLAKYYGANVTGVASQKHLEKLKKIKIDKWLDYNKEDISKLSNKYNVILDAVGYLPRSKAKLILKKNGNYFTIKSPTTENLTRLKNLNKLLKKKNLITIIDQTYNFNDFRQAHKKVYDGHKTGNIVIKIS